jgi:hypothetical protein
MREHTHLPAMVGFVRKHVAQHFQANGPRRSPAVSAKLLAAAPTTAERFSERGGPLLNPQNSQTGTSPSGSRFDFSQELFRAEIHSLARVQRTLLSAAFDLDFTGCGINRNGVSFPFPTCLAASLCLES